MEYKVLFETHQEDVPKKKKKNVQRFCYTLFHIMLQEKQQWQPTNHYVFHNTDKLQLVTNMQHELFHSPLLCIILKDNSFLNDASSFLIPTSC